MCIRDSSQACTTAAAPRWSDPSRGQTRPRTAASSRRYGASQAEATSNSSGQTVTSGPGKARGKAGVPARQNNDTCRLQIVRSARVDHWQKIKNPRRRRAKREAALIEDRREDRFGSFTTDAFSTRADQRPLLLQ